MVYSMQVTSITPAGVMELVDVVDSKSTDGDIVPVRVRPPAPINPIVNDTFTMGFIFVPVGLEPQVRVWGARGALPVADEATRVSGSGRQMPRSAVDAGRCRAPQQDIRHHNTYPYLIQWYQQG